MNLTESLALEWACYGIRVNAVAPGIRFSESAQAHYKKNGGLLGGDVLSDQIDYIPVKRMGSTQEVGSAVLFLLSPAASYITGAEIKVDGAATLYGQLSYALGEVSNYPRYGDLPSDAPPAVHDDKGESGTKSKL
jgi:enoyl-[acyl-carrier-protein] reductase (NADH)